MHKWRDSKTVAGNITIIIFYAIMKDNKSKNYKSKVIF